MSSGLNCTKGREASPLLQMLQARARTSFPQHTPFWGVFGPCQLKEKLKREPQRPVGAETPASSPCREEPQCPGTCNPEPEEVALKD